MCAISWQMKNWISIFFTPSEAIFQQKMIKWERKIHNFPIDILSFFFGEIVFFLCCWEVFFGNLWCLQKYPIFSVPFRSLYTQEQPLSFLNIHDSQLNFELAWKILTRKMFLMVSDERTDFSGEGNYLGKRKGGRRMKFVEPKKP